MNVDTIAFAILFLSCFNPLNGLEDPYECVLRTSDNLPSQWTRRVHPDTAHVNLWLPHLPSLLTSSSELLGSDPVLMHSWLWGPFCARHSGSPDLPKTWCWETFLLTPLCVKMFPLPPWGSPRAQLSPSRGRGGGTSPEPHPSQPSVLDPPLGDSEPLHHQVPSFCSDLPHSVLFVPDTHLPNTVP